MVTPVLKAGTACPGTPALGAGAERLEVEEPFERVKQESEWPSSIDGVIDLDAENEDSELMAQRESSSSDEDSSSSEPEDSDVELEGDDKKGLEASFELDVALGEALPSSLGAPVYYVNGNSLVVHLKKSGLLKCGRKISSSYRPIHDLRGFRCGKCFTD